MGTKNCFKSEIEILVKNNWEIFSWVILPTLELLTWARANKRQSVTGFTGPPSCRVSRFMLPGSKLIICPQSTHTCVSLLIPPDIKLSAFAGRAGPARYAIWTLDLTFEGRWHWIARSVFLSCVTKQRKRLNQADVIAWQPIFGVWDRRNVLTYNGECVCLSEMCAVSWTDMRKDTRVTHTVC